MQASHLSKNNFPPTVCKALPAKPTFSALQNRCPSSGSPSFINFLSYCKVSNFCGRKRQSAHYGNDNTFWKDDFVIILVFLDLGSNNEVKKMP